MRSKGVRAFLILAACTASFGGGWFASNYFRDNPRRDAIVAYRSGDYDMALRHARARIATAGLADPMAHLIAARSAFKLQRYPEAALFFSQAATDEIDDMVMHARALLELGKKDDSALVYESVLAKAPNHGEALKGLSSIRVQQNRFREAAVLLGRLIEIPGFEVFGHAFLGMVEYRHGGLKNTIKHLQEALRLSPDLDVLLPDQRIMVLQILAECLMEDDQYEAAEAHAQRALEISPHPEPAQILARIEKLRGNEAKAVEWFQRALERDPNNVFTLTSLARIALAANRTDEAIDLFKRAEAVAADDPRVRSGMVEALLRAGRQEEAEKYSTKGPEELRDRAQK